MHKDSFENLLFKVVTTCLIIGISLAFIGTSIALYQNLSSIKCMQATK